MKAPIVVLPLKQYEKMKEELEESKHKVEMWKATLATDIICAALPHLRELFYTHIGGNDVVNDAAHAIAREVIDRIESR